MAQEKRDEREQRRRSALRRRVGIVIAIVLGVAALSWVATALWNAPVFSVDNVVVTGNRHLSTTETLQLAAIPGGSTLLKVPLNSIASRMEQNPWVASATVSRKFPHTLVIDVAERVPAAYVDAGANQLWVLSADGYWLGKRGREDTAALATIRDVASLTPTVGVAATAPELKNAVAVLGGLSRALQRQVKVVSAPTVDKTALILNNGVQIFIGSSDDIAKKDLIARGILAREKNIVYINVRVVDRPTWRGLDQAQ